MKLKRLAIIPIVGVLCLVAVFSVRGHAIAKTAPQTVAGGRFTATFETEAELDAFSLYTEHGRTPVWLDGTVHAWVLAEQKIIYNNGVFTDVDVSVDITTVNVSGKFDAGIYLGASDAGDAMDMITAYCINLEHGSRDRYMTLKLHRFDHGRYVGAFARVYLPYVHRTVRLRAVVCDGLLRVYLDGATEPQMTYAIGTVTGQVGLRSYYAPTIFDNFSVTGGSLPVDRAELDLLMTQTGAMLEGDVCEESRVELTAARELAQTAQTQAEVDAATSALSLALGRAVPSATKDELAARIALAEEKVAQADLYTRNSYNSLVRVLEQAKLALGSEDGYELAYWSACLQAKIDGLICYGEGMA